MEVNFNSQFNGPKKQNKKNIVQKPWFVPLVLIVAVSLLLFIVKEKDKIFVNKNPYNMKYVSVADLEKSLETKEGPNGEETYMLIFGSNSCGACKALYKYLEPYNKKLDQGYKNGYVPNYTTDIDIEKDAAYKFGDDYILEKKYRSFLTKEEKLIKSLSTPTIFFVTNKKLRRIIVGAPKNQLQIIKLFKEEYANS